jgi:hypothetical protein
MESRVSGRKTDVWFLRLIREFELVTSVVDEPLAQRVAAVTRWATVA